VWQKLARLAVPTNPEDAADLAVLRAMVLAGFRDFEAADAAIADARARAPSPWVETQAAFVHELADRYDEALALVLEQA
jgi:hypothetical protein